MTDLVTIARLLRDCIARLERIEAAVQRHNDGGTYDILSFAGDAEYDDGNGCLVSQGGVDWTPAHAGEVLADNPREPVITDALHATNMEAHDENVRPADGQKTFTYV